MRRGSRILQYGLIGLVWCLSGTAKAALPPPLTLSQIDALTVYVVGDGSRGILGTEGCAQLRAVDRPACLAALGSPLPAWDRDKNARFERRDIELAYAQLWGSQYVCESNGAVLFPNECPNACERPVASDCTDSDGDGLYAYQENEIRSALNLPSTYDIKPCLSNAECSFQQSCERADTNKDGSKESRSICVPRACAEAGTCTAFHLVTIAEDDRELLVHVYYDYSPQPARVLDLRVKIPATGVVLADSRLLEGPAASRTRTLSTQVRDTKGGDRIARLTIMDTNSGVPIPFGPVAELVFIKQQAVSGTIAFSSADADRDSSMAPNPSAGRTELRQTSLWGSPLALGAGENKLLAHYHFDREADPLELVNIRSLDAFCSDSTVQEGAVAPAPVDSISCLGGAGSRKKRRQLSDARSGVLSLAGYVDGVLDRGARFSSGGDHIELPIISRADQANMSWSFWIRPDEYFAAAGTPDEQLVWAAADVSGTTRVSLVLTAGTNTWVLRLRQNGAAGQVDTVIGNVAYRAWTYVGFVRSGASAKVYLNGAAPISTTLGADIAGVLCPAQDTNVAGNSLLQAEVPGDRLVISEPTNSIFSVNQVDGFGAAKRSVQFTKGRGLISGLAIDPNRASSFDADYSPVIDKIAFVSTQPTSPDRPDVQEVWLANADGSDAKPVTDGFGIPSKGVYARRPRISPDGTVLLFESNVFDVRAGDNPRRVYRLFSIPLAAGVASVPTSATTTAQVLVYQQHLGMTPPLQFAWVTKDLTNAQLENYSGARFVGNNDVLVNSATADLRTRKVLRLTLAKQSTGAFRLSADPVAVFGEQSNAQPILLDARIKGGSVAALIARETHNIATSGSRVGPYTLTEAVNPNSTTLTIKYEPRAGVDFAADCWDSNGNYAKDTSEDKDRNGVWDHLDCGPVEITTLAVSYGALPLSGAVAGPWFADSANKRKVRFVQGTDSLTQANLTTIEVTAPMGGVPLPNGATIATLTVGRSSSSSVGTLRLRTSSSSLEKWVFGVGASVPCLTSYATSNACYMQSIFEAGAALKATEVVAGAVAPDGADFVVSAIQASRPTLLRIKQAVPVGVAPSYSVEKISEMPSRIEGIDWESFLPIRPCHLMAAKRNNQSGSNQGRLEGEFRGELDEIKVYNYVRADSAFRSEWARGDAWNRKENPNGAVALATACKTDTDCPAYQRCMDNGGTKQCAYDDCNSSDPCSAGQCAWVPPEIGISGSPSTPKYACFVECEADSQCFSRECYNGPCRFCDSQACLECRWNPNKEVAPGVSLSVLEGCPDDNRFACDSGSCVSECYSTENGQSRYLCTTNEYCRRGRCVAIEWDWTDFAPGSLTSGGSMVLNDPNASKYLDTIAQATDHSIEIWAYGNSDVGIAPQLRVQAKAPTGLSPFGSSWFELATLVIENTRKSTASSNPYRVFARYPIDQLRFTLVAPPTENPNRASVGYGSDPTLCGNYTDFKMDPDCTRCLMRGAFESPLSGDLPACGAACGTRSDCARLPGTRRRLGYSLVLPDPRDTPEYLTSSNPSDVYLRTGEPTVIVTGIKVDGVGMFGDAGSQVLAVSNKICAYGGNASRPASATDLVNYTSLASISTPYLVLNCPDRPVSGSAPEAILSLGGRGLPGQAGGAAIVNPSVKDLGSGCFYDLAGATPGAYPLCYGFVGSPSFDPLTKEPFTYGSLEIGRLKPFGYEKNALKRP